MGERAATNRAAALRLRVGGTADGWRLVAIIPASPWPWCLVERGTALGRCSPAAFLAPSDRLPSSTPLPAQRAAHSGPEAKGLDEPDLSEVQRAGQAIRGDE